ncbi:molybdopterin molybdotransferase MoeA [Tepidibacter aestuarii]|uniref:molybdopterin molybdotransferase MoeA n=1 Tax=Tepidibacter aestuarii TaxID=2925782 RepID=UPI0020C13EEC|nr:molybdopterin molybdotransferase MoeA [Tepidibacter aestuarii]CAH2213282.1 Molybdopterin molybdenumtransferase [Tepidibacter aestuarii]
MWNLITLEEAHNRLACVKEGSSEYVNLEESIDRIASENIYSDKNLPGFKKSMFDGYAVKSEDISKLESLEIIGNVTMGKEPKFTIKSGQCSYITTGAMLPNGANTVVMVEDCDVEENHIRINTTLNAWDNITFEDEDLKQGDILVKKGQIIKPYHIAVLAGVGITDIKVKNKINIGIISTGDEIVSPYDECTIPQIRDINGYYLDAQCKTLRCNSKHYGIAKDDKIEFERYVQDALRYNDIVILSGASSVGAKDYTPEIVEKHADVLFHGVAIKPGKPTLVAKTSDNKYIVGLPGNPLSSAVSFKLILSKIIDQIYGTCNKEFKLKYIMKEDCINKYNREFYAPAKIEGNEVKVINVKSSAISVMLNIDGFIKIDKDQTIIKKGEEVEIII